MLSTSQKQYILESKHCDVSNISRVNLSLRNRGDSSLLLKVIQDCSPQSSDGRNWVSLTEIIQIKECQVASVYEA